MIFHENRLPADDSHEMQTNLIKIMPYLLFLKKKKQQNLKLSSAANYRWCYQQATFSPRRPLGVWGSWREGLFILGSWGAQVIILRELGSKNILGDLGSTAKMLRKNKLRDMGISEHFFRDQRSIDPSPLWGPHQAGHTILVWRFALPTCILSVCRSARLSNSISSLDKQRIYVNTQLKSSKKQLKLNVCVPKSNSVDRYAITCDVIA